MIKGSLSEEEFGRLMKSKLLAEALYETTEYLNGVLGPVNLDKQLSEPRMRLLAKAITIGGIPPILFRKWLLGSVSPYWEGSSLFTKDDEEAFKSLGDDRLTLKIDSLLEIDDDIRRS